MRSTFAFLVLLQCAFTLAAPSGTFSAPSNVSTTALTNTTGSLVNETSLPDLTPALLNQTETDAERKKNLVRNAQIGAGVLLTAMVAGTAWHMSSASPTDPDHEIEMVDNTRIPPRITTGHSTPQRRSSTSSSSSRSSSDRTLSPSSSVSDGALSPPTSPEEDVSYFPAKQDFPSTGLSDVQRQFPRKKSKSTTSISGAYVSALKRVTGVLSQLHTIERVPFVFQEDMATGLVSTLTEALMSLLQFKHTGSTHRTAFEWNDYYQTGNKLKTGAPQAYYTAPISRKVYLKSYAPFITKTHHASLKSDRLTLEDLDIYNYLSISKWIADRSQFPKVRQDFKGLGPYESRD